jgi:hypothetical protein
VSRNRFPEYVPRECSPTVAKVDFADVVPRGIKHRRCVHHASDSIIIFDYRVRVCVDQHRDCLFFLASEPKNRMLVNAIKNQCARYATHRA